MAPRSLINARAARGAFASVTSLAALLWSLYSVSAVAQPSRLIVRGDRGGPLEARIARIEALRREGIRVEIPDGRCLSACTLYLGLAKTCVGKVAIFGFHGPTTQFGTIALPQSEFDRLSHLMAKNYPESLRGWFLEYARYRTLTYSYVTGAELIRLGMAECPAR